MKYSMRRTLPCWPSGVRQERVQVDALLGVQPSATWHPRQPVEAPAPLRPWRMLLDEQVDHPVELGLVDLDAVMAAPRAVQRWAHLGHADPAPPQRQRMLP